MSDLRKAAQMALEALEWCEPDCEENPRGFERWASVMPVLREALAQTDEKFCDTHCTWRDHHPDCAIARSLALPDSEGGEL